MTVQIIQLAKFFYWVNNFDFDSLVDNKFTICQTSDFQLDKIIQKPN